MLSKMVCQIAPLQKFLKIYAPTPVTAKMLRNVSTQ